MKIILLKDVSKVGRKYEVKNVADGYAQNALIPRGLAVAATAGEMKKVETMKQNDTTDKKIQQELLLKNLEVIKNLTVSLKEKANDKGHLFAGVTREMLTMEIAKAARLTVDPEWILLPKPLKEVGEFAVAVEVSGKHAEFKVVIEKE